MIAYAVARWLSYAATFVVIGAATEAFIDPRPAGRFARRLSIAAAALALIATAGRLVGQAATLLEPGDRLSPGIVAATLSSRWGTRWEVQGVAALIAFAVLVVPQRNRSLRWSGIVASGALAFTLPLTGHAVEFPLGPRWGMVVHGVHLLAGGVWLGTLAIRVAAMMVDPPTDTDPTAAVATWRRFSALALPAASLTIVLGVLLAWADVGSWAALADTSYGWLLLGKLALLAGVLLLGANHWRALRRPGEAVTWRNFARTGSAEAVLALVILGVTAVLVATEAPCLR